MMKVKDARPALKMWIGEVNMIGKWMDGHKLPFRKEDVVLIPDDDEAELVGWEFTLDREELKRRGRRNELSPGIFDKGKVKITFCLHG